MEEVKKPAQGKNNVDQETLSELKETYGALPKALNAEKNLELLQKYKETGDPGIRNQIICGNLRFAVKFTHQYFQNVVVKCYNGQTDDLINDLSMCLYKAVEKFDIAKGYKFLTFASAVIRSAMLMKYRETKILKNKALVVSFSSPANRNKDGKELTYEDVLADDKFTEENFATSADLKYILEKIIPTLSKRERKIFKSYFIDGKTQKECTEIFNLSQGVISRQISKIRRKIINAYKNGMDSGVKVEASPTIKDVPQASFEELLAKQHYRNQCILKDYFAGELKLTEVAKKYNMSVGNVAYVVNSFKFECEQRKVEIPERMKRKSEREQLREKRVLTHQKMQNRNQEVVKDYFAGMSMKMVAQKHSLSIGNVSRIVSAWEADRREKDEDIPMRQKVKSSKKVQRDKSVWDDYVSDELSLDEIAKKHSISKKSVHTIISQINAERSKNGEEVFFRRRGKYGKNSSKQRVLKAQQSETLLQKQERNNAIWADYVADELSFEEIAKKHSVSKGCVKYVVANMRAERCMRGEAVPRRPRHYTAKVKIVLNPNEQIDASQALERVLSALPDKKREIFETYRDDVGEVKEIAKRLGVTSRFIFKVVADVRRTLEEMGFELPENLRVAWSMRNERNNNIWQEYLKGEKTVPQIAKEYSLSIASIRNIISKCSQECQEKGIEVESQGHKKRQERDNAIWSDYMSKMSLKEIAEKYSIPAGTVKYVVSQIRAEHRNNGEAVEDHRRKWTEGIPLSPESATQREERNKGVLKDYMANEMSLQEVAGKYHIAVGTVKRIVAVAREKQRKNGEVVEKRKKRAPSQNAIQREERNRNIWNDYIQGGDVDEIAEKYSVSRGLVKLVVSKTRAKFAERGEPIPRRTHFRRPASCRPASCRPACRRLKQTVVLKQAAPHDVSQALDGILAEMPEEKRTVFLRYHDGVGSVKKICKDLGVSLRYIFRVAAEVKEALKKRGIEPPESLRKSVSGRKERNNNIWNDYLKGEESLEQIAKKYSMSLSNLGVIISKFKSKSNENAQEVSDADDMTKDERKQSNVAPSFEDILSTLPSKQREIFEKYQFEKLQNAPCTMDEIAVKIGASKPYIYYIVSKLRDLCKEKGVEMPETSTALAQTKQERNNNIWQDYLKGEESLEEIAKKYSISLSNLGNILLEFKSEYREKGEEVPKRACTRLKSKTVLRKANQDSVISTFEDVLSALPKNHRDVFESYQKNDCTVDEIAKEFGVSQSFVYKVVDRLKKECQERGIQMPRISRQIVRIAVLKGFEDGTVTFEQVDKFMGKLTESQRQALFDWRERKQQEKNAKQHAEQKSEQNSQKTAKDADEKSDKTGNDGKIGENDGKGDGDGKGGKGE